MEPEKANAGRRRGRGRGRSRGRRSQRPSGAFVVGGDSRQAAPDRPRPSSSSSLLRAASQAPSLPAASEKKTGSNCYRFCTPEECAERQELKQVSFFEATSGTYLLPQKQRVLDGSLALPKYRRSAAGTDRRDTTRSAATLEATLEHIVQLFCHRSAHLLGDARGKASLWTTVEFVVDRLRACQSDAIRLSAREKLSPTWHLRFARILVLALYLTMGHPQSTHFFETTCKTMLETALEMYWDCFGATDDDEVLSLMAMQQYSDAVCQSHTAEGATSSYAQILHAVARRQQQSVQQRYRPAVLSILAHSVRQEFRSVLTVAQQHDFPVLLRCCLAQCLVILRYNILAQYNVSLGKSETVRDVDIILCGGGVDDAKTCGLTVVDGNAVIFKERPIGVPKLSARRDDGYVGLRCDRTDSDGWAVPEPDTLLQLVLQRSSSEQV